LNRIVGFSSHPLFRFQGVAFLPMGVIALKMNQGLGRPLKRGIGRDSGPAKPGPHGSAGDYQIGIASLGIHREYCGLSIPSALQKFNNGRG
jgi:hypothetical protein